MGYRTPHAWTKVVQWSSSRNEFEKRTAFALLWSLTVHDKCAGDELFEQGLALTEREAGDERHFVKKATALRALVLDDGPVPRHAAASRTRRSGCE